MNERRLTPRSYDDSHAHLGPVIGAGYSCPTEKKNHCLEIIPGFWSVRQCERCGAYFSRSTDLLVPGARPPLEVVRDFAEAEGVPVRVDGMGVVAPVAKASGVAA